MNKPRRSKIQPLIIIGLLVLSNLICFGFVGNYFSQQTGTNDKIKETAESGVGETLRNPWQVASWSYALFQFFRNNDNRN